MVLELNNNKSNYSGKFALMIKLFSTDKTAVAVAVVKSSFSKINLETELPIVISPIVKLTSCSTSK